MTGATPEVPSNKGLTLLTFDLWFLTFNIWHMTFDILGFTFNQWESENMWDAFRKSGNSAIDKSSRASSNLLPSGVLLGKFHENVLFNLHADGINDQRKKFEKFVKKPCIW